MTPSGRAFLKIVEMGIFKIFLEISSINVELTVQNLEIVQKNCIK